MRTPTINETMQALVDDLHAGDVPDPLGQSFMLANVWLDLCVLAGEEPPACVLIAIEGDTASLAPAYVAQLHAAPCQRPLYAD